MKTGLIFFCGLGIGAAALAFFLRSHPQPADIHLTLDTALPDSIRDPSPLRSARASSLSSGAPSELPHVSREQIRAAVHAKLHAWLSSKTGDTRSQETLTAELLTLLSDDNTAEIIASLSADEFSTPFGTRAVERWLKIDFAEASRWLAARPDASDEHALLVARRMLEDSEEMHAFVELPPDGAWKQRVLAQASAELTGKNPAAAIAIAQRLSSPEARANALETVAYAWFAHDLTAATDWVRTVDDPALRERLLAVAAKAIATADPDLAAGWLVSAVKSEGVLHSTALTIVETWADQQPAAAANWVARFSDAGPRKAAIAAVLSHWLKSDPMKAHAWIQSLPEREVIAAQLKADQAERERPPE